MLKLQAKTCTHTERERNARLVSPSDITGINLISQPSSHMYKNQFNKLERANSKESNVMFFLLHSKINLAHSLDVESRNKKHVREID